MPALRVYAASFVSPATPRLRVYGASAAGAVPTTPALRVYKVSATGAQAVTLNPILPQTVEPQTTVTVTAVPATGSATPDSYVFRQISGPTVSFSGTGATRTFESPSAMPPGTDVVVGVTGLLGGVPSAERTCTVSVLPQLSWSRAPGAGWVGARTVA